VTQPQPTDQQYRDALYRTFDLADDLLNGTNAGTLWPDVTPASQMESDNTETEPFQMAHIIQTVLNAAIEHLHATAGLVRKAELLHNSPPFTMCRAAVETAATAYWLLQPKTRASGYGGTSSTFARTPTTTNRSATS